MIKNYFVITLRNFVRNKNYSLINILGLTIGITCCIIIYLLISYDLAFDQFHSGKDQIFRVVRASENASGTEESGVTPYPFAAAFRNDFPQIPLVTQYHLQDETMITIGVEKQLIKNVLFADSVFFRVFDFEVVSGNPISELGTPGKVFITESLSKKLFPAGNGGHLKLGNVIEADVAGIIKDPPPQSHIQFSMIVSLPSLNKEYFGLPLDQWGINSAGFSYLVLPGGVSKETVEQQFKGFVQKYYESPDQIETYFLQPLKDVHFDERFNKDAVDRGDLVILGLLGLFILSIACINFINLATALAIRKSKEIGIRKTLGAVRTQLTLYFLGETFLLTFFSVLISLGLVEWLLPWLNDFLDKQISQSLSTDYTLLGFLFSILFFVTIFSGLYPAIILSGYNPVSVLKNKITGQTASGIAVRKVLVAFQFLIAQALIIGTLVVADQMAYFRNKPLGFNKDAIINVSMPDHKPEMLQSFRSRLEANPQIESISFSIGAPVAESGFGTSFRLTEGDPGQFYDVTMKLADHAYGKTYGLELLAGRWMTEVEEKLAGEPLAWEDRTYVAVINESAMKQLGFTEPEKILGKRITIGLNDIDAPVVGVVKDFHTTSMHQKIRPVAMINFEYFYYDAGIKVSNGNLPETLEFIKKTWSSLNTDYYFHYSFLDERLAGLYKSEERTFTLFKIFATVSVFIGCLGLYGLISFMATQKQKEVGIRKVMGATAMSIVVLFSKEFVKLIIIAFLLAAPLAWFFMKKWLEGFAYKIDISWSAFVIAISATLIISILTVSYNAIRAAVTNPAYTLRSE
jgi:putative ABC transport system permease protein